MKLKFYTLILITIFISIMLTPVLAKDTLQNKKPFGPWYSKLVKVEQKKKTTVRKVPSTTSWFFNRFIRMFQLYISPQDGPSCRYSPTCSKYGEICINHYGPLIGVIMTADRFMRCNPFGSWGKDPTEENYFWDKKQKQENK